MSENKDKVSPSWMAQVTAPKEYVLNRLKAGGHPHESVMMKPTDLKPIQTKISKKKAEQFHQMMENNEPLDPIYVAQQNEVLDGHHRGYAAIKHPDVEGIGAIKIQMDYRDAMRLLNQIQDRYQWEQELGSGSENDPLSMDFSMAAQGLGGDEGGDVMEMAEGEEETPEVTNPAPQLKPNGEVDDNAQPSGDTEMLPQEVTHNAVAPKLDDLSAQPAPEGEDDDDTVDFDSATKNAQTLDLFKAMPINTNAKTGDFLLLSDENMKQKYTISFDNLLTLTEEEIADYKAPKNMPTFAAASKLGITVDFQALARQQGIPLEVAVSREVNKTAYQQGVDGIQYGDIMVQIINKPF